jgi:Transmembrane domain of unknown function (DUF3566)
VAKVALLFNMFCGVFSLLACVGLWFAADRLGARTKIESFLGDLLGTKNFQLFGDKLFRAAAGVTVALILLATVGTVFLAFVYNMLSSIFGGVVVSVLHERQPMSQEASGEAAAKPLPRRRRRRRFGRRREASSRPRGAVGGPGVGGAGVAGVGGAGVDGVGGAGVDRAGVDGVDVTGAVPAGTLVAAGSSGQVAAPDSVWAAPDVPAQPAGRGSTAVAEAPTDDNWIAAAVDPTGSWMAPGSR